MLSYLFDIFFMLFIVSFIGYICVVLKEKINLKNNMIIIDKKSVTQENIAEADMKFFKLGGEHVKSGDEVTIVITEKKKISGIVIGAIKNENVILVVTHNDKIRKLKINKIEKFKVVSKYGKFF